MSKVNTQWKAGRCRNEAGVFFRDDSGMLITGTLADGYTLGPRQPMGALFDAYADDWAGFAEDHDCRAEAKGLFINAGRGAHEDSAYIAVIDAATAELVWLAHLPGCPAIGRLMLEDSRIVATPGGQSDLAISIPLQAPTGLAIVPAPPAE